MRILRTLLLTCLVVALPSVVAAVVIASQPCSRVQSTVGLPITISCRATATCWPNAGYLYIRNIGITPVSNYFTCINGTTTHEVNASSTGNGLGSDGSIEAELNGYKPVIVDAYALFTCDLWYSGSVFNVPFDENRCP